jgi:hypothetical protein
MSWELGKHRNTMRLYNMEVFDRIKEVFVMLLVMDACAAATCPCNLHTGCKWPAAIRTDEAYCYNRSRVEKVDGTCEILSEPCTKLPIRFSDGMLVTYTLPMPDGHYPRSSYTYPDNIGCIWQFPTISDPCKFYEISINSLDFDVPDCYDNNNMYCECSDHILVECDTGEYCHNSLPLGMHNSEVTHYCSESLTIKFRTDGSGGATGYRIKVSKLNDCTKAMSKNEPFDVFAVPSIAHCPPLTLKYIKDAYAKTLAYVSGDPGHGETKTPIQQCYCSGTCTANTEEERTAFISEFFRNNFFEIGYLNSPDSQLRKMARQAKILKESKL